MKRKWLVVAIAISVILSVIAIPFSGCAAPAPAKTYNWVMTCFSPEGYLFFDLSEDFISRVEEASDGRISITLYPGDLLGDPETKLKSLTQGTQDLGFEPPSTVNSPKWDINNCWYLMDDWDTYVESYSQPDGWLYKVNADIAGECNWKQLAISLEGGTHIISNVEFDPVPGPKNIKLRVMASESARLGLQALGFSPITMPWSEIPSALMLGTIDGAHGPTSGDDFVMLSDCYKYAYRYFTNMGPQNLQMNLDLFNSMSAADQAMLEGVGQEWQVYAFAQFGDYNDAQWDKVRKTNTVIDLTHEQWCANAKVARPVVWPIFEEVLGSELMEVIKEKSPYCP